MLQVEAGAGEGGSPGPQVERPGRLGQGLSPRLLTRGFALHLGACADRPTAAPRTAATCPPRATTAAAILSARCAGGHSWRQLADQVCLQHTQALLPPAPPPPQRPTAAHACTLPRVPSHSSRSGKRFDSPM